MWAAGGGGTGPAGPWRDHDADRVGLTLPRTPRSVALLRRYAADTCAAIGWPGSADVVALLVSEAVTDGVLNSRGDRITVRVLDRGLRLRVEVAGDGPAWPGRSTPHGAGTGGPPVLVDTLSTDSGAAVEGDRWTLWFELGA